MGIKRRLMDICFVSLRVLKYRWLSDCRDVSGKPGTYQPVLLKGKGRISFGQNVQIGVIASPQYYSGYAYLEARKENSRLIIGNQVSINNGFSAVAFDSITIGNKVLIGVNCSILDNDAHHLDQGKRNEEPLSSPIFIEDNVFLGSNVTILKGVRIGKNSVIGNASVVTRDIPENAIAAGNPARVIRQL